MKRLTKMRAIRFLLPALLAISGLVNADSFSDLSSCGQGCINNMRESTPCVPVTDECLCDHVTFQEGIRDCADQACSASEATAAIDYASSFCLSVTGTASSTAAATSTSEAATSTSTIPTTMAAVETTTSAASSSATSSDSAASSSDGATSSAASSAASSTTSASTTDASSSDATSTASSAAETSSASGTASGTSAGTETSSSSSASASSTATAAPTAEGLSVAAKAGVAVGAGAVGVALLALAIAMCRSRRNRRPLPRGTMQISEPLPGSGRIDYSVPNQPQMAAGSKLSTAFNMGELDQARPYEEMVPRVTPRRMV